MGPNASGKSTFLDVIHFASDFVQDGLDAAIQRRSPTFQDLLWGRRGSTFRFSLELTTPPGVLLYTVAVALDEQAGHVEFQDESATLVSEEAPLRPVMTRSGTHAHYFSEDGQKQLVWGQSRNQSSLNTVLSDELFPAMASLRDLLAEGIRVIDLDPRALTAPSPPERGNDFVNIGASLAWQVWRLQDKPPEAMEAWTSHVRTALPDVCKIESVLQQWDNRRFVRIQYENGVQVPAWILSEGTLRLLALTILAYLPDFRGLYLIEEPENGVHPAALETIYQSLSSVYNAQVLVATHSPVLLSMARPEQILCFSKTREGTTIIRGSEHPALKEWQGEVSLGTMVASGILS